MSDTATRRPVLRFLALHPWVPIVAGVLLLVGLVLAWQYVAPILLIVVMIPVLRFLLRGLGVWFRL